MNPSKTPGLLYWLTFVVMEAAIIWALGIAPPDKEQGELQRIFYFHMGSIWPGFMAFFYVLYASVRYLTSRRMKWDDRALSSGMVGLAFCTIVLVTGPIWAKPVWGIWWTWDARLTSTLVLWVIFLGYVNLREYMEDGEKRARVSAVLGILGACMVPFVYMSTRLFEGQHPKPVIAGEQGSGIFDTHMRVALILALTAFTLLYLLFWRQGIRILEAQRKLRQLHSRLYLLEESA